MKNGRTPAIQSGRAHDSRSALQGPETIRELLISLVIAWGAVAVLAIVMSFFSVAFKVAAAVLFLGATLLAAKQFTQLLRAKREVLSQKDVPILWGLGRLIAWDPVEGVLFLRNKQLGFMDGQLDDDHGGIRCIYPILGDELALRVPLEIQTLEFADDEVLTREYLSVTIRGSMRWQITDLRKFYLQVSRELRSTGELADRRQQSQLKAAPQGNLAGTADVSTRGKLMTASIEWLRLLAEERTRTVVSRVSSGLLIAERLADTYGGGATSGPNEFARLLSIPSAIEGSQEPWRSATESLSQSIAETVAEGVADSGISIVRVSLQEIRLPPGIVHACKEAAQAAYLPLLAQRQAATKRADLAAEIDLLGRETVGAREVLGAAPPFTLVDFLSQFVSKQLSGSGSPGLGAGLLAGAALGHGLESTANAAATKPTA